jgi:hypothetical protein
MSKSDVINIILTSAALWLAIWVVVRARRPRVRVNLGWTTIAHPRAAGYPGEEVPTRDALQMLAFVEGEKPLFVQGYGISINKNILFNLINFILDRHDPVVAYGHRSEPYNPGDRVEFLITPSAIWEEVEGKIKVYAYIKDIHGRIYRSNSLKFDVDKYPVDDWLIQQWETWQPG